MYLVYINYVDGLCVAKVMCIVLIRKVLSLVISLLPSPLSQSPPCMGTRRISDIM